MARRLGSATTANDDSTTGILLTDHIPVKSYCGIDPTPEPRDPFQRLAFVEVDRAADVSVEARVEEAGRILQRRALGEGELHHPLVRFARADHAVVRPHRRAHPLPLLDDVRVGLLDEVAHPAERLPAPVPELGDSLRDEIRCRLALARARPVHAP